MAAKKTSSPSLAEIEKDIARLTAELRKARIQKVSDAEKNLQQAKTALAVATDKANKPAAGKSALKKAGLM